MKLPFAIAADMTHMWLSASEAARHFDRSRKTITVWCNDGTLVAFNIRVYRDISGHWWIGIPNVGTVESVHTLRSSLTPTAL